MGNLPVSGQLERTARAARVAGIYTIGLAVLGACLMAVLIVAVTEQGGSVNTPVIVFRLATLVVVNLLPGALLWWLGRRLDAGGYWAFVPILVVIVLSCSVIVFATSATYVVSGVLLRIPMLYALAMWMNGVSEYRDHRRHLRHRRVRRGFEVMRVAASPEVSHVAKPPPPVRMPPRPRR